MVYEYITISKTTINFPHIIYLQNCSIYHMVLEKPDIPTNIYLFNIPSTSTPIPPQIPLCIHYTNLKFTSMFLANPTSVKPQKILYFLVLSGV